MEEHCQFACRRDEGSFLSVPTTTLGQLQTPAPKVPVRTERTQDVLRPLHQQGAQIRVAFLADVHLRFALAGVSSPGLQPQIATHVAALSETMRIFQPQQERQRDQRAYALDLLQQSYSRITLLCQILDALVVFHDVLAQR